MMLVSSDGQLGRRIFGFRLIFLCILLVQTATCAETPAAVDAPKEVSSSTSAVISSATATVSVSTKPEKQKTYVVVDEKVQSPQPWNSWTPMPSEPITVLASTTTAASPSVAAPVPQQADAEKRGSFQQQKKQEIGNLIKKDKQKYNSYGAKPAGASDEWPFDRLQKQVFSYGKMLLDNFVSGLESSAATAATPAKVKAAKAIPMPMPVHAKSKPILGQDQATAASAPATAPSYPYSHYNGGHGYGAQAHAPTHGGYSLQPTPPNDFYSAALALPALASTYYNAPAHSSFGGEAKSIVDWISKLIGVGGKTLGEFLREYQVHVLYDMVFLFFKWLFFLYAGLMIP